MAATPSNADKLDGPQGTSPGRDNMNAGAAQPSKTDYKALLDKVAAESQGDGESGGSTTGQSDGLVSKLVGQGKQLLGLDNSDSKAIDKVASSTSEPQPAGSEGITDTHVHEFIRDAHRSQKVTPKAAEGL
ncbi:hypothetical protein F503_07238 [Ophiostoma piceae UAMH 11346]|uniref:Uncharacterized protein n=1 Tax=Ophiostoma piceae (strain UAMH 11346) TaxID=1262450 RepID=S3C9D7_OPHP1|nr:hypothetical protein F503_07238 [Ophiostoma piceae UAMH 11346]